MACSSDIEIHCCAAAKGHSEKNRKMNLCLYVEKTGIILLLLTSFLSVASTTAGLAMRLRRRYDAVRTESGVKLCALGTPFKIFTKVRTMLSCSAKCAQLSNCERFNFKKQRETCEIFVTMPLQFETANHCQHYQLKVSVYLQSSSGTTYFRKQLL